MILDLTLEEIKDLAEFSGFVIDEDRLPDDDNLEEIVCITKGYTDGLQNDEDEIEHHNLVMYFESCPEEGVIPLGNPIRIVSGGGIHKEKNDQNEVLNYLITEREDIRRRERKLTKKIKKERQRISEQRKANKTKNNPLAYQKHKQLISENAKLRAMVSLLEKESGQTYKLVGEKLEVGPQRARELVKKALRLCMKLGHEEQGKN